MDMDKLYNDVVRALTDYENPEDIEEEYRLTQEEWAEVFYELLVRFQNRVDDGSITLNKC